LAAGLTDIAGIKVGTASNLEAATGVTVVLVEEGARAAVEVRGSAPGTRETDLLCPGQLVENIQAIVLAGGSAFGLDAASGVVRYLEDNNRGFQVGQFSIPIVPAAVLFDLFIGDGNVRPDSEMGYRACISASPEAVAEGSMEKKKKNAVKSGQGSSSKVIDNLVVAALVAVNAFGDIYDNQGRLLAGPRNPETGIMEKTLDLLINTGKSGFFGNTTLGVVATNADLDKAALNKICQLAHDGLARSIWPVHTMWDGDTIFALSKGNLKADLNLVGLMAAEAMAAAVRRAVIKATSLCQVPSISELGS